MEQNAILVNAGELSIGRNFIWVGTTALVHVTVLASLIISYFLHNVRLHYNDNKTLIWVCSKYVATLRILNT